MPSPPREPESDPIAAKSQRDERAAAPPDLPRLPLWLVDGYNTLHCLPGLRDGVLRDDSDEPARKDLRWWSARNRKRLVALARRFPDPDAEIRLVFDGPHPAPESDREDESPVSLAFTPSADDWIVKFVRASRNPAQIAVVTRDRQVADRVRQRGAVVIQPRSFLEFCALEGPL